MRKLADLAKQVCTICSWRSQSPALSPSPATDAQTALTRFHNPISHVDGSVSRWHNDPPTMARKASPRKRQRKRAGREPSAASSDRLSGRTPSLPSARSRRDLIFAGFLLLLLLVIYNSNFRTIHTDDSFPARFLPFSLLLNHNLNLDPWMEPRLEQPLGPNGTYFAQESHGHWMSGYPIITPVLVTPLYVLPAWWISHQSPPLPPNSLAFVLIAYTMEKLSASLIAAMSGALLFLAFRKVASRNVSLMVALIYGLASNTWTISSQALWRHGLTELSFAFLLWALFRVPDSPSAPCLGGPCPGRGRRQQAPGSHTHCGLPTLFRRQQAVEERASVPHAASCFRFAGARLRPAFLRKTRGRLQYPIAWRRCPFPISGLVSVSASAERW